VKGLSRSSVHYLAAILWVALTVSLASWWLAIGLRLPEPYHRMFRAEGSTFIALLVGGGIALTLAIRREHVRRQALEMFFLSFTHDLKTALARVQLQAEGMREDWPAAPSREALDRLLQDALRLQIQLENSLFVAQPDGRLLRERIDVGSAVARLAEDWPELDVRVSGDATVTADARAFDAVVRNLLQNAVVHGGAHRVDVRVATDGAGLVRLILADDGRGVSAEALPSLGQPFTRASKARGGTGMGLFVCGQLVSRMHGSLRFVPPGTQQGFTVELDLPGAA
jgi:signal transduction histidine kinase